MEDWLRSIGLGDRIAAFRENRITQDQLPDLTEADLRELGLTIGERKRFLRALAERSPRPAGLAEAQAPYAFGPSSTERQPAAAPPTPAERRPLTIMFVDLIDSTQLGERLDAEDLLEVIRRYREFAVAAVTRFGGHVARFIGDGILAYFGYPAANENDPERAVRAALAITDGIGALRIPVPIKLQVRIGLATGRVVVSELFTGATSETDAVLGSVPNLAARLQAIAPPNGIIISDATHTRVRHLFACESLGPTELRGFDRAHEPWRVTTEAARVTVRSEQADAAQSRPLTPFSDREAEMHILRAVWQKAVAGDDSVVLITGEAGIGKSRLLLEFCNTIVEEGGRVIRFAASAFDADSPLRPFADYVAGESGILPADELDSKLRRLGAFLGPTVRQEGAAGIIAALLGIRVDDPAVAALLPEQLRDGTIATLVEHLLGLGAGSPLCIVVEDLHWLDPTSRDLLDALKGHMRGRRVLLVLTARAVAEWIGRVDTTVRLKRLPIEYVSAMVRGLLEGARLTAQLADYVASKADGVPLFIEEVTRLLLQRLVVSRPEDAGGQPDQEIPASLDELLMAVLDRAGSGKALAQVASVLGTSFRRDIVAAMRGADEPRLDAEIAALLASGIIERDLEAPQSAFRFHHALLRDTAYMSMVRERRRALHADAARAIERLAPDLVASQPELLGLHLAESGAAEDAAPYWLEAARRSLARSALLEASRVLRRALADLERLTSTPKIMSLRLQLSALLGPALISLQGPNAPETQRLYTSAYELGHELPEEPAHFPIYWGWWRLEMASEERTMALLDRAKARSDPGLLLQAHHCCWSSYMNRGTLGLCCEHIQAGLEIYHASDYRAHARLYGNHDAKACAHGVLAQVLWMQGKLGHAVEEEVAGLRWAEEMDHLGTRVHARGLALLHRVYRREHELVLQQSDELIALTAKHGMAGAGEAAQIFRGWAVAAAGEPESGLRILEQGWARQREIATNEDYPVYLCLMADVLTALGRAGEAVERIRSELDGFERSQLRIWLPELERVLGDAILAHEPANDAEARHHYIRAADLATFQAVPMLGLRIALSEARLDARTAPELAARRLSEAMARLPPESEGGSDLRDARAFASTLPSVEPGPVWDQDARPDWTLDE